MRKKLVLGMLLLSVGGMLLAGCGKEQAEKEEARDSEKLSEESSGENPFDQQEMDAGGSNIQAAYGYGISGGDAERYELHCGENEGPVKVVFSFENDADPIQVGLLVFVDGIVQEYYTDSEKQASSLHVITLEEDTEVPIYFDIDTDVEGDVHQLTALSIYEPEYTATPEYVAYGNYGSALATMQWALYAGAKPETHPVSHDFELHKVSSQDKSDACRIYQDKKEITDAVESSGELTAEVRLRGETDTKKTYRLCAFINNQLVPGAFSGKDYAKVEASRTEEASVKLECSLEDLALAENNTLYVCYIPDELEKGINGIMPGKSSSVLLIRK